MIIMMESFVGDFGEDKNAAADLREHMVRPALERGEEVTLDFRDVSLVTQSFIHALISDVLRTFGESALDKMVFSNGTNLVQGIVSTVVQYSLDTIQDEE